MDLPERKRRILKVIVENYIETAEPVGSKVIVSHFDQPISSATIRNEMSELEELGYLEKPHVSAGRIPSYSAYRLYVNELMDRYRLASRELEEIQWQLREKMREMDNMIVSASRVISKLTNYTSVSMLTRKKANTVKKVELIPVDEGYTYAVVLITDQLVKSRMLRLEEPINPSTATVLAAALNLSIGEGRLDALLPSLTMGVGSDSLVYLLMEQVVRFIEELEAGESNTEVHVEGASRLLNNREYQDIERMRQALEYLSDQNKLRELIYTGRPDKINFLIGPETGDPNMRDASFVFTTYDIDENIRGVVGVIAPTRMDYARVSAHLAAFVQSVAQLNERNQKQKRQTGENDDKT